MTQALAVGMNGVVSEEELDRIENFFFSRESPAIIDLCTLADVSVDRADFEARLRGTGNLERSCAQLAFRRGVRGSHGIEVRAVEMHERDRWGRLVMEGFTGITDVPPEQAAMLSAPHPTRQAFFCSVEGSCYGGAAMEIHEGLATLYGDATIEAGRGRGLQLASIRHRMRLAAQNGCDLASASVVPGGISNRNYERAGFQLVYTRIMFSLKQPA